MVLGEPKRENMKDPSGWTAWLYSGKLVFLFLGTFLIWDHFYTSRVSQEEILEKLPLWTRAPKIVQPSKLAWGTQGVVIQNSHLFNLWALPVQASGLWVMSEVTLKEKQVWFHDAQHLLTAIVTKLTLLSHFSKVNKMWLPIWRSWMPDVANKTHLMTKTTLRIC